MIDISWFLGPKVPRCGMPGKHVHLCNASCCVTVDFICVCCYEASGVCISMKQAVCVLSYEAMELRSSVLVRQFLKTLYFPPIKTLHQHIYKIFTKTKYCIRLVMITVF